VVRKGESSAFPCVLRLHYYVLPSNTKQIKSIHLKVNFQFVLSMFFIVSFIMPIYVVVFYKVQSFNEVV